MFGWEKRKSRKKMMRQGRHLKKRYGRAFGCNKAQIDTTFEKCKLDENYLE